MIKMICGNCRDVLPEFEDNSVDSIVTDPPAGIAFMGKEWDKNKGDRDSWIVWMCEIATECIRVLKPGGHALVWALPRTSHWTATAWENAGFELRDKIFHGFGSGFPKSLNISKAIDKAAGVEREIIGHDKTLWRDMDNAAQKCFVYSQESIDNRCNITAPATEAAKKWEGFGTGLKPAIEEWLLLRKPISESTIANNVIKWGVGALNIDGCRIEVDKNDTNLRPNACNHNYNTDSMFTGKYNRMQTTHIKGRYPATFIHDGSDELLELFLYTETKWGKSKVGFKSSIFLGDNYKENRRNECNKWIGNSGSASRYFYCAKPSQRDRDGGLEDFKLSKRTTLENGIGGQSDQQIENNRNTHPTVKSTKLMRYLCRLIAPPNGLVLDPFAGSGSTGKACAFEGFDFIGIEKDIEYVNIAQARIQYVLDGCPEIKKPQKVDVNQINLF